MRKVIVLIVALSLILPALAFAGGKWSISGRIKDVKNYPDTESHGYIGRIDVKTSDGHLKKIYIRKETLVVDVKDKKIGKGNLKVGKNVQVDYKKNGEDLLAFKVTVL